MKTLFHRIEDMVFLNRHCKTQHQPEIKEKLKLVLGSELRKEYVTKKKVEIRGQNVFYRSFESLAMIEASYDIALELPKKGKLALTEKKLFCLVFYSVKECAIL